MKILSLYHAIFLDPEINGSNICSKVEVHGNMSSSRGHNQPKLTILFNFEN